MCFGGNDGSTDEHHPADDDEESSQVAFGGNTTTVRHLRSYHRLPLLLSFGHRSRLGQNNHDIVSTVEGVGVWKMVPGTRYHQLSIIIIMVVSRSSHLAHRHRIIARACVLAYVVVRVVNRFFTRSIKIRFSL